jgi:hypothetical protein
MPGSADDRRLGTAELAGSGRFCRPGHVVDDDIVRSALSSPSHLYSLLSLDRTTRAAKAAT